MTSLFQVKIWFQNRRTKWKKHDNISNAEAVEHKPPGGKPELPPASGGGGSKKSGSSSGAEGEGEEHSSMDGSESCYSVDSKPPVPPSPSPPSSVPLIPPAQPATPIQPSPPIPPIPLLPSVQLATLASSEALNPPTPDPPHTRGNVARLNMATFPLLCLRLEVRNIRLFGSSKVIKCCKSTEESPKQFEIT